MKNFKKPTNAHTLSTSKQKFIRYHEIDHHLDNNKYSKMQQKIQITSHQINNQVGKVPKIIYIYILVDYIVIILG